MPKMIQADGEAMPAANLSRRNFLRSAAAGLAVSTAAAAPAAAAIMAPAEAPALLALAADMATAKRELAAAIDAKDWLVDEWRHVWPLAPDEIAYPGFSRNPAHGNERGLDGKVIIRRDGTVRHLRTMENLECMADPEFHPTRRIKCPKRLARIAARRAEDREALQTARLYYAETERVRQVSGIDAAEERITRAKQNVECIAGQIMAETALTTAGLAIQIEAFQTVLITSHAGPVMKALAPLQHADKLLANMLAFAKGGAA